MKNIKEIRNIKKPLLLIFKVIVFIAFLYSLITIVRYGKQEITVKTVSNFNSGSDLNAIIEVTDKKTEENIKSNLKVELLDNDGKKVKGVKENYKITDETVDIALPLPEDLKNGKYSLKVTSTYGIFKEVEEVPLSITQGKSTETIISLDKGIYKPGDDINYRALVISKQDNTPIVSNDIEINIYDGNDNRVYAETATTSEFGIVSGNFKLSDVVNSGTYKLTISTKTEEKTKEFIVNPYVTPKFEVNITSDKDTYLVGETANVTIDAKYFFGEPVTNASIKGTINDQEFTGITNESGSFTKQILIEKEGKYDINLSVEDSSNYFIEAGKSFYGATGAFEIEILPEFNEIIKGVDNEIYVITKTIDNKPVKTHMSAKFSNITRDIITDENGVGKLVLTSSDISLLSTRCKISITAEDMSGQKIEKSEVLKIVRSSGTIVKTDKAKYEEGENIEVSLISSLDNQINKNLYIFKNKELIKTISFEGENVDFSLDGIYGLVDIYYGENGTYNYVNYYYYDNISNKSYDHKTIFIKPSKQLNINIQTDKDTYKPKETLNIDFSVSDESNQSTDTALLVSILDEAVLSLADNDLSIDNLKVALNDIELSNGITATDLYAMMLDDSNSTTLSSILLKQNNTNSNQINTFTSHNYDYEKQYIILAITSVLLVGMIFGHFLNKYEKFRKIFNSFIIALIDIIFIFGIISIYFAEILNDMFANIDLSELVSILVCIVSSIVIYNLILYKEKEYMYKLIQELILVPAIVGIIVYVLSAIFRIQILPVFIILAMLLLLCVLTVISRNRKLSKFWSRVKDILYVLAKSAVFWLATYIVCEFFDSISGFIITLLVYIIYEKIVLKKTNTKIKERKIIFNITGNELIGVYAGIILILIVVFSLSNISGFTNRIYQKNTITDSIYESDSISDITFSDITTNSTSSSNGMTFSVESIPQDSSSTITKDDGLFDSIDLDFSNRSEENKTEDIAIQEREKDVETEENVRNIFLESLAFIPEVVTNNGTANLQIPISDNITTWNIQTVGNSKDGRLGFSSNNFKVFKEFFADFSLPTNTVVTDKISIPVTLYNYTENALDINLNVVGNDWSNIGEYTKTVNVPSNSTQMVYVPLEITKSGENKLRIETSSGNISDIVEKTCTTSINGIKSEDVASSGSFENKGLEQDILFKEEAIDGTKKIKVKLYPSTISQIIENMDKILEMPTGCFEQVSSSLYPDILALEYLKENNLNTPEIEEKALKYISTGYQKLLTYEVDGVKGGYSLYGRKPAEVVITAFGLMEMNDMKKVYEVDENVIENMKEYLFDVQNINGSFDYNSTYIGGASSTDDLAMNSYIIWALSEVCPEDSRLEKSIKYLEDNVDKAKNNYTLALMANAFSNVDSNYTNTTIKKLMKEVKSVNNESAYIESNARDYWGTYGKYQYIQTTALTSLVLTKEKTNSKTNDLLINYIISSKDTRGSWHNTQSTVLALKAINEYNTGSDVTNQKITVELNGETKEIEIGENALDVYEFEFSNVDTENKFSISMKKGKIYYEIVKEYYKTYEKAEQEYNEKEEKIIVEQTINNQANVNDIISQNISLTNQTKDHIQNLIVRVNIPQGCSVIEDSLLQLEYENKIEKFEYNYNTIDLYIRNCKKSENINLLINYRASYPAEITGASIRAYDYYNPEIEGIGMPVKITVK